MIQIPNIYTCQNCLLNFDEDDIVWANMEGQIGNGLTVFNNFAWCVPCLPSERASA